MRRKLLSWTLAAAVTVPVFASHLDSHAATRARASGGTLSIGLSADPPKLDPSLSTSLYDRQVMINMFETLFKLGPNNTLLPGLVQTHNLSIDRKRYIFHLRKGVTFQDGTPFNAASVKFNFERDMQSSSPRHSDFSYVTSVSTPDPYTVIVQLKQPFSPFLYFLTDRDGMIASPTAVQKEGSAFMNNPVGSGPFQFVDRVKGDHIDLKANVHYWGGAPKVNQVVYKIFTDSSVELTNLQSGAIQIADTAPAQQVAGLEKNPNYTVFNKPGLGWSGFYLNCKTGVFSNKYLREAVNLGIDRKTLVNVLFKDVATPGYSPFGTASPAYDKTQDTPPSVNAAKIKSLLVSAGHPNGFSFVMKVSSSPVDAQFAQVVQSMLSQVGIQMTIRQEDFGTLLNDSENGSFEAAALSWSGRTDPDQNIYQFFTTGDPNNSSLYSNPQVDRLLKQARGQAKMSDRTKTYAQIDNILHEDAPYVFLYHSNNVITLNKKVHGFQYITDGLIRVSSVSLS